MHKQGRWDISAKNLISALFFLVLFLGFGVWAWLNSGHIFYLFNFGYIGFSLSVGVFLTSALPRQHKQWGRRVSQLLVGCYMLFFLGLYNRENMQIEGFFFYLLTGVFAGATMHYAIAKIVGPLIFSRAWCGYACWTAMILDLLPYKTSAKKRQRFLGMLRYLHFFASLALVLLLWSVFEIRNEFQSREELYWLIIGNLLYYIIGIGLAFLFQDNRAFCKYLCPIPTLQKITSRFSLIKNKIEQEKCINCGLCEKACPMDIRLLAYKNENKRVLSTECILCNTCANVCPKNAISTTIGFDVGFTEKLYYGKKINSKADKNEKISLG